MDPSLFTPLFELAPEAMVLVDASSTIVRVNAEFVRLFGWTGEQAVGRSINDLIVPAERMDEALRSTARAGRGERSLMETVRRRRDGTPVDVSVHCTPVVLPSGEVTVFSIYRDITAARKADAELRRSRQQLRELAARVDSVREEQRAAIAREIHDELGQALTGLRLELSFLDLALPGGFRAIHQRLHSMVEQVDRTIESVRRISSELHPGVLAELGLVAAVEWQADRFAERSGLRAEVAVHGEEIPIEARRATAVFRILQEALTNVARHAAARCVGILLDITPAAIVLEVRDDGRGIAPWEAAGATGLGLIGMRERALQWEGEVDVHALPGGGTIVRVVVPQTRTGEMAITP